MAKIVSVDLDKLEKLFRAAQMHPKAEREEFVIAACEGDETLRRELLSLLNSHDEADNDFFLKDPYPFSTNRQEKTDSDRTGERVGPYVVMKLLGRGGMGDVFLASQEEPFRRLVALKIIRRGMDSDEVVQRFEMERQILAALDHPNIGRLLDGGVTSDGLPYFALEYIDGIPITQYCDKHRLSINERVELFRTVCLAVHYAHQNLVIHRDLKPSNILVSPERQVKLLDFGIAKLVNPSLSSVSAPVTRHMQRPMTPEYASPEQVSGDSLTTSSDVYSLGVILYELLAGRSPYQIAGKSTLEIARVVCEEVPVKPSTSVAHKTGIENNPGIDEISLFRNSSSDKLARTLRGDLDNIVMMALRKEPARRYASAGQLAADLSNYLADLPVIAHHDTRLYRVKKFIKRRRIETAAVSFAMVVLLGFSFVTTLQSKRISQERDKAQTEAAKARQVTNFVLGLFENADPSSSSGDSVLVKSVLETGATKVQTDLQGQPVVQAEMLGVIAQVFGSLGDAARSSELLRRAISLHAAAGDTTSVDYANLLFHLALNLEQSHQLVEARTLYTKYLALAETTFGPESPEVVGGMYHLGYIEHISGNAQTADSIFNRLGFLQSTIGPTIASSMASMAEIFLIQNDRVRAEQFARDALNIERRISNGEVSASLASKLTTLAWILNVSGEYSEAELLGREALAANRRLYPGGHRNLSHNLSILAESLMELKRYSESESLYQESLEMSSRIYGDRHPSVARDYSQLGRLMRRRGEYAASAEYYARSVEIYSAMFGDDYLVVLQLKQDQALAYKLAGMFQDAERLYLTCFERLSETRGVDDPNTIAAIRNVVSLYSDWGRDEEAARYRDMLEPIE